MKTTPSANALSHSDTSSQSTLNKAKHYTGKNVVALINDYILSIEETLLLITNEKIYLQLRPNRPFTQMRAKMVTSDHSFKHVIDIALYSHLTINYKQ